MLSVSRLLLPLSLLLAFTAGAAEAPAKIMIVGTYHMSNPGQDLNNVEADDVLKPQRQKELQAITASLARFKPTRVAVEWPADVSDERYAQFVAGTLPESRNEVVQLGFRLAQAQKLERVYGLDVDGDFPFEALQQWAQAHGRAGEIEKMMADGAAEVAKITALQKDHSIGGVLRYLNTAEAIAHNHSFYPAMLTMGAGNEQPGAALVSAWQARNLAICARLLQTVKPGDRVVAFYGQGHVYLLRQCIREAPGVEWVEPMAYLPR